MSLFAVIAASEENLAPLDLPIYWYAIIPAAIAVLLGFVTWSFRDVANRHRHKTVGQDEAADN